MATFYEDLNQSAIDQQDPVHEHSLMFHCDTITSINFHPNGKQLITSSLDKSILLWNITDTSYKPIKLQCDAKIYEASVNPHGNLIASAGSDYCVRIWDNANLWKGHTYQSIKAHSAPVKSCHFSCDNKLIVSGSDDKMVKIINVIEKKVVSVLPGHENWLKSTRFSYDSNTILSCGDDKTARIWDVNKEKRLFIYEHPGFVNSVRYHPDDSCFATACYDKKIRVSSILI